MFGRLAPHPCLKDACSDLTVQFVMNDPPQLRRSSASRRSRLLPTLEVTRSEEDIKLIKEARTLFLKWSELSLQADFLCALISEIKGDEYSRHPESKQLTSLLLEASPGSRVGRQSTQEGGASPLLTRPRLSIPSPAWPISISPPQPSPDP